MRCISINLPVLFLTILAFLFFQTSFAASMTVQSLSGAVTATEISSFKSYMQTQSPSTVNTYDNTLADGNTGTQCEALGQMYEVTNDPGILNQMIQYADAILSLRNNTNSGQIMWTGLRDPVWLTKATNTSSAGYAGCENNDIAGHVAYCAKLILETPSLWNTTVSAGDPYGFGATYWQRAQTYVTEMDRTQDAYMLKWFIDPVTSRIVAPTSAAWTAFGQSVNAWNRQMMFMNAFQRLSECHALLGDSPSRVAQYDAIVQASMNWFESEWQNTTSNSQACYLWDYAPGFSGGNEEMNGHAAYDMWGLSRASVAGKYGMTPSLLRPFAETLINIIYQAGTSYTFAEWVSGDTSSTRNYIYGEWMGVAAYDPCAFSIMANADISQGSQSSTPIYDSMILWVKNARYRGFFPNNCGSADYSFYTPWIQRMPAGRGTAANVTVYPVHGFTSTVTFTASGLPPGAIASFNPASVTASGTTTVTITLPATNTAGIYAASVIGVGGGITRVAPVEIVVPPLPRVNALRKSGSNLYISGTNGVRNGSYYLLTSTNLSLPYTNWTRLATNPFDSNGLFNFTNIATTVPGKFFYLLQEP